MTTMHTKASTKRMMKAGIDASDHFTMNTTIELNDIWMSVTTPILRDCSTMALPPDITSQIPEHPRFTTGVDLVSLEVSARDAAGRFLSNLTAADFLVLEDGTPRTERVCACIWRRRGHDDGASDDTDGSAPARCP